MPTQDGSADRTGTRTVLPFRFLIAAAVVGCALRLAFGLGYWTDRPLTRDEQEYLSLARSLAAGRGFVYDNAFDDQVYLPFGRAPGYPTFVALVGGGGAPVTTVPVSVKVAQAIVGGIGVWLVGVLAARLAGDRGARVGATLAAIYPPLVWISGYALSEALFWPMGLTSAWLYSRLWRQERGAAVGILCGVACGLGILTRPSSLLFVPLAVLGLVSTKRWYASGALLLGVLLVVGPWTWRNHVVHGRFMIVASDGGVTFWTGNHALAFGEGDMATNPALKEANHALRASHPGLSEEQMEPIYYREARRWIGAHPGQFVVLEFKKAFYTVIPAGPSYRVHSRLYAIASIVSYSGLAILAIAGAWTAGRRIWQVSGLVWLGLSSVLVCLIFFPQERFRIPILDPVLIVLASGIAGWRGRQRR